MVGSDFVGYFVVVCVFGCFVDFIVGKYCYLLFYGLIF